MLKQFSTPHPPTTWHKSRKHVEPLLSPRSSAFTCASASHFRILIVTDQKSFIFGTLLMIAAYEGPLWFSVKGPMGSNPGQLGLGSSRHGSARPGQLGHVNSALYVRKYSPFLHYRLVTCWQKSILEKQVTRNPPPLRGVLVTCFSNIDFFKAGNQRIMQKRWIYIVMVKASGMDMRQRLYIILILTSYFRQSLP